MEALFWENLGESFRKVEADAAKFASEEDCDTLRILCERAGVALFNMIDNKMLDKVYLGVDVNLYLGTQPVVKKVEFDPWGNPHPKKYYSEYWVCYLASLAKKRVVDIKNKILKQSRFPFVKADGEKY